MSDNHLKVKSGDTINITLRRKQQPSRLAPTRPDELKVALPFDDEPARYIRRTQGKVTVEFFDMGANAGGASPAFTSGGTASDYERPTGGFLFGPYVTADGQSTLDTTLDASAAAWPLSSPQEGAQPLTWAGVAAVNGVTVGSENVEENRFTVTIPRSGTGLLVTTSGLNYLGFNLTNDADYKVTASRDYDSPEVSPKVKSGDEVRVLLKPTPIIFEVAHGGADLLHVTGVKGDGTPAFINEPHYTIASPQPSALYAGRLWPGELWGRNNGTAAGRSATRGQLDTSTKSWPHSTD
jgi:hypothetical protein